jgi:biopolymer transport protein ExbD/biopolymer transport protein TolR
MSFSTGAGKGPQSDINVTPLVDVVLVLLIIFMVVTPLLQVSMKADVPKKDEDPPPDVQVDPEQVVISMQAGNVILLNSDSVTEDELSTRLAALMKGRKKEKKIAFLSGTDDLYFGQVIHVMDLCKGAGVDRVGLIDPLPMAGGM